MKKTLAILLAAMLIVPALAITSFAEEADPQVKFTVEPSASELVAGDKALEVTYTIKADIPADVKVDSIQLEVAPPEGMVFSDGKADENLPGFMIKQVEANENGALIVLSGLDEGMSGVQVIGSFKATIEAGKTGAFEPTTSGEVVVSDIEGKQFEAIVNIGAVTVKEAAPEVPPEQGGNEPTTGGEEPTGGEQPTGGDKDASPKTGDSSDVMLWVVVAALAMGAAYVIKRKRA